MDVASSHWVHDIITQHAPLTTTGGRIWDAARRLASFLEAMSSQLGLHRPGLSILELGSGLGWLGMTLARNLPQARLVVLTEQETGGGLDWLRHNLSLNTHLPGMGVVRAESCDWLVYGGGEVKEEDTGQGGRVAATAVEASQPESTAGAPGRAAPGRAASEGETAPEAAEAGPTAAPAAVLQGAEATACAVARAAGEGRPGSAAGGGDWLSSQHWDLILGSDLVYNDVGAVYLPRVMRALACPTTRIIYCHTKHRFDTHDMRFFEELAACGLQCREAHEPSVTSPPPSPPPLTELFPEMRIAVYDIRLAQTS